MVGESFFWGGGEQAAVASPAEAGWGGSPNGGEGDPFSPLAGGGGPVHLTGSGGKGGKGGTADRAGLVKPGPLRPVKKTIDLDKLPLPRPPVPPLPLFSVQEDLGPGKGLGQPHAYGPPAALPPLPPCPPPSLFRPCHRTSFLPPFPPPVRPPPHATLKYPTRHTHPTLHPPAHTHRGPAPSDRPHTCVRESAHVWDKPNAVMFVHWAFCVLAVPASRRFCILVCVCEGERE